MVKRADASRLIFLQVQKAVRKKEKEEYGEKKEVFCSMIGHELIIINMIWPIHGIGYFYIGVKFSC